MIKANVCLSWTWGREKADRIRTHGIPQRYVFMVQDIMDFFFVQELGGLQK